MADQSDKPLSVYRLLPALTDHQLLHVDSLLPLFRWQTGKSADRPARLGAEWMGDRWWPKGDFASGYPGAPVLSARLVDAFGDELSAAGSLVPVDIAGAKDDTYYLYAVEQVVDCLDLIRSSKPKTSGEVKKPVFRPEALPAQLPAFRLPQSPRTVQWNGWAVDRLRDLAGDQIESRLLWSQDPSAKPHPDPWGI
jgi:hypothetical protein